MKDSDNCLPLILLMGVSVFFSLLWFGGSILGELARSDQEALTRFKSECRPQGNILGQHKPSGCKWIATGKEPVLIDYWKASNMVRMHIDGQPPGLVPLATVVRHGHIAFR